MCIEERLRKVNQDVPKTFFFFFFFFFFFLKNKVLLAHQTESCWDTQTMIKRSKLHSFFLQLFVEQSTRMLCTCTDIVICRDIISKFNVTLWWRVSHHDENLHSSTGMGGISQRPMCVHPSHDVAFQEVFLWKSHQVNILSTKFCPKI